MCVQDDLGLGPLLPCPHVAWVSLPRAPGLSVWCWRGQEPVQAGIPPGLDSAEGRAWAAGDSPSQVSPLSPRLVPVTVQGPGACQAPAQWPPAPALPPVLPAHCCPRCLPKVAPSTPRQAQAPLLGMQGPPSGPDHLPHGHPGVGQHGGTSPGWAQGSVYVWLILSREGVGWREGRAENHRWGGVCSEESHRWAPRPCHMQCEQPQGLCAQGPAGLLEIVLAGTIPQGLSRGLRILAPPPLPEHTCTSRRCRRRQAG